VRVQTFGSAAKFLRFILYFIGVNHFSSVVSPGMAVAVSFLYLCGLITYSART